MNCPRCESEVVFCGCPACGWRKNVGIAAAALPNRGGAVVAMERKQERWDRDGDAYKRLVNDGIQPPNIDGSRELEQTGISKEQIETARVRPTTTRQDAKVKYLSGAEGFRKFEDTFEKKVQTPA